MSIRELGTITPNNNFENQKHILLDEANGLRHMRHAGGKLLLRGSHDVRCYMRTSEGNPPEFALRLCWDPQRIYGITVANQAELALYGDKILVRRSLNMAGLSLYGAFPVQEAVFSDVQDSLMRAAFASEPGVYPELRRNFGLVARFIHKKTPVQNWIEMPL